MNNFIKGLILTGMVPVVAGVVSAVVVRASLDEGVQITFGLMWWGALFVFIVTMIVGLVSRTFKTRDGRAGVLTGIGLAVVALGTSCFAMIA